MAMKKPKRVSTAIGLLYASSLLGLLEVTTSATLTGGYSPFASIDITLYSILLVIAFIIGRGINTARVVYILLAVIWFGSLLFVLPSMFHHKINLMMIFMQLVLTIAAVYMLYQQKSNHWFRDQVNKGNLN